MKKIISLLLVFCMVLGMSVSVWAEGDFLLSADTTIDASDRTPYGNLVGYIQRGETIDGAGYTLTVNGDNSTRAIMTYGGTIQNLTIVGGQRGIVLYSPTEDVIINNVKIDSPGYAINTAEHPTVDGIDLIVTNSTINGWTSFAGISSASFTNCSFGENTSKYWQNDGYDRNYDRLVKPYVNTKFDNCKFEAGFYIDLSALGEGCKVTLDNCTVNGTAIDADNYSTLLTAIELPAGRALEDCVTFIVDPVIPSTPPVIEEDTTVEEDTSYEEEEEDTHTSSSDMDELIDETPKNATEVTIDDVNEDTTISKKAMEKAIEEGLDIEFKGDSYILTLKTEDADFSNFKGTFNPYIDTDANCTTSMKSELKKNDIDASDVQVIKTEFSGDLPGEMELTFTLNKELRGQKLYFYYWNPELKQYEQIPCTVKGNKLTVKLSHFSTYIVTSEPIVGAIVVEEGATVTAPIVSVDKANPETGASDFVGVAVALAVVSVAGVAALSRKK